MLTGAATVNIPAIVLSGGPMLDGHYNGRLAGSGTVVWEARRLLAAGTIDYDAFMDMVCASAPSVGHCNTMGTALSMNSLAEALGMSLPGCAAIPGPYRERRQIAYLTGRRIVEMVREDLTPRKVMTKEAFENSIVVASAIGASTNCPPHLNAIARHVGVELTLDDWQRVGHEIPRSPDQARHRLAADHRQRPAERHIGQPLHPQRLARSGGRRQPRVTEDRRQGTGRSAEPARRSDRIG
jgi:dihydroxy-acid dehydratase